MGDLAKHTSAPLPAASSGSGIAEFEQPNPRAKEWKLARIDPRDVQIAKPGIWKDAFKPALRHIFIPGALLTCAFLGLFIWRWDTTLLGWQDDSEARLDLVSSKYNIDKKN